MRKTLMFLFIAFCFSLENVNAQSLPFIEKGKSWHIIEYAQIQWNHWFNFESPVREYDMMFREDCDTIINGTTYSRMTYENVNGRGNPDRYAELLREDEGRVYMYYDGKEELLYDFTLNEGDEIELRTLSRYHMGEYDRKLKVDKVTYVDVNGKSLKTLRLSGITIYHTPDHGDEEYDFKYTWMEGVGDLDDPLSNPNEVYFVGDGKQLVPYVLTANNFFIPFDISYHMYHGQQLKLGKNVEADIPAENWGKNDLHYEFIDDGKLHISGLMWMSSSPNQYIFCYVKPSELNLMRAEYFILTTNVVEVKPYDSHVGAYYVDIYFDNFYYKGNYHITDNNGTHMIKYPSDPDAISSPKKYISSVAMPYDLSGRTKGNNATKGIYIKDGKKYIVK